MPAINVCMCRCLSTRLLQVRKREQERIRRMDKEWEAKEKEDGFKVGRGVAAHTGGPHAACACDRDGAGGGGAAAAAGEKGVGWGGGSCRWEWACKDKGQGVGWGSWLQAGAGCTRQAQRTRP